MKSAPILRALGDAGANQVLVHTGQHYDHGMSGVFFEQLGLPRPDVQLGVGSGSHTEQTAAVMSALEPVITCYDPGLIVVYGDVNSTIAAALVSVKLSVPIAHVEAGLRSFDMSMPEEVNRRITDTLSSLLFATSPEAMAHLGREGIDYNRAHFVGNPMIDTLLSALPFLDEVTIQDELDIGGSYAVATIHRPSNVDNMEKARDLVSGLRGLSAILPVIVPLHPRGRANLREAGLDQPKSVKIIDPIGYVEFLALVKGASLVVTDSGGVQEETTVLRIPCLTVRRNTERPVTITQGTNELVDPEDIPSRAIERLRVDSGGQEHVGSMPPLWDGRAGKRIAGIVNTWMERR